jgi:hypothetical protein
MEAATGLTTRFHVPANHHRTKTTPFYPLSLSLSLSLFRIIPFSKCVVRGLSGMYMPRSEHDSAEG